MEGIIKQLDKRNGRIYCYTQEEIIDPVTGKTKKKRTCVGRWNPESNTIDPTGRRGRPRKASSDEPVSDDLSDYRKLYLSSLQEIKAKDALIQQQKRLIDSLILQQETDIQSVLDSVRSLQRNLRKSASLLK